jgi:hypothetical protein
MKGRLRFICSNPASNYFTLNINTTKVQVFSWQAGKKSFDTSHSKGTPFVINDLSRTLHRESVK